MKETDRSPETTAAEARRLLVVMNNARRCGVAPFSDGIITAAMSQQAAEAAKAAKEAGYEIIEDGYGYLTLVPVEQAKEKA